jgi:hypothetical protein
VRPSLLAVAVAALTLLAQPAPAQTTTFTSLAGPWWFTIGGKDKGSIVIQFGDPTKGVFLVEDVTLTDHSSFGFSRALAAFFLVAADQELALDSERNITGTLELTDPNGGDPVGTLTILKGKPDKTFTTMKLRATIEGASGPLEIKLKGVRPPDAFPVLSGRTTMGNLKGKGVSSKALDLSVLSDGELGPPAYAWNGTGPAKIDGSETTTTLDGHIMLTPSFKAHGLLESSSDFGEGLPVEGKLRIPDPNTPIPKVGLNAEAVPTLKIKGQLTTAVDPILQVTPVTFDFGAVRLDDPPATHTFLVKNIGVGSLSGSVAFLGETTDFSIEGSDTFGPLDPNTPAEEILVAFDPDTAGAKSAQLRFGVDTGLGSIVVPLTGTGGVASLSVDPNSITFPNTSITATTPAVIVAKVTNDGDTTVTGQATIENPSVPGNFALADVGGAVERTSIPYTLAPGADAMFEVRFHPIAAIPYTAQLGLSGAGPKSVPITGTGTSP